MFWAKVERAEKHIDELKTAIDVFMETNPYRLLPHNDPKSGQLLHYVWHVRDTPVNIPIIFGDILNNLRSALDHLVYELAIATGVPFNERETQFPVGDCRKGYFKAGPQGKISGISQEARDIINRMEPYKGGNARGIWLIDKLNNIDKHRHVVLVGGMLQGAIIKSMESYPTIEGYTESDFPAEVKFTSLDGLTMLKDGNIHPATKPDYYNHIEFFFTIAINEPKIVVGVSLIDTISELLEVVKWARRLTAQHDSPPGEK